MTGLLRTCGNYEFNHSLTRLVMAAFEASTHLDLKEVVNELREVTDSYSLGLQLGVKQATLKQIESDYHSDTERRKTEIVSYWMRNASNPSWKSLAKALEDMPGGHKRLAERLKRKTDASDSDTLGGHIVPHEGHEQCNSVLPLTNGSSSHDSDNLYDHCKGESHLPASPTYDESDLELETDAIMLNFGSLVTNVKLTMEKQGITVQTFADHLQEIRGLKPVHTHAQQPLLDACIAEVRVQRCLGTGFKAISGYYSWFNHQLIDNIIKTFCKGNKDIAERQAEFQIRFRDYCHHRISKCPKNGYGFGRKQDARSIILKVDQKWSTARVEQVTYIRNTVGTILGIVKKALYLRCVENGCLQLTFLVPEFVADTVFRAPRLSQEQEQALVEARILELHCGSFSFHSTQMAVDNESTPDESQTSTDVHRAGYVDSEPSKSVTTHSYGIDEYEKKYGETFLPGKGQTEKDDEQSVAVRGYESLQSVYQLPNSCQTSPEDRCLPPCSLGVGDLPSRLQTVNTGSLTTSTTGSQTRKSQAPHPTGRQYQQYKLMVRSVSVSLGPQDVDSIVYMKDIPAEYRRSALVVLQYLERIGDIGYRKVDPLIELLKGISRIDLVSEHVQPYKKRYNSTSDKEETADSTHMPMSLPDTMGTEPLLLSLTEQTRLQNLLSQYVPREKLEQSGLQSLVHSQPAMGATPHYHSMQHSASEGRQLFHSPSGYEYFIDSGVQSQCTSERSSLPSVHETTFLHKHELLEDSRYRKKLMPWEDDEQLVAVGGDDESLRRLPNSRQTSPEDRCLPPRSLSVGDLPSRLQTVNTPTTSTTGSQTRKSQAPHPTGRRYQQYKLMVLSVSVSLGPQDVDTIVYMKDIPAEYRRSALVVLQYLERIGDIGYRKVDPLIELLKGISRIDLVSEHVQPYKKRYNSTSDKEETADSTHMPMSLPDTMGTEPLLLSPTEQTKLQNLLSQYIPRSKLTLSDYALTSAHSGLTESETLPTQGHPPGSTSIPLSVQHPTKPFTKEAGATVIWKVKRDDFILPIFHHKDKCFEKKVKLNIGTSKQNPVVTFKLYPNGLNVDKNRSSTLKVEVTHLGKLERGMILQVNITGQDCHSGDIIVSRQVENSLNHNSFLLPDFISHEIIKLSNARNFQFTLTLHIANV